MQPKRVCVNDSPDVARPQTGPGASEPEADADPGDDRVKIDIDGINCPAGVQRRCRVNLDLFEVGVQQPALVWRKVDADLIGEGPKKRLSKQVRVDKCLNLVAPRAARQKAKPEQ